MSESSQPLVAKLDTNYSANSLPYFDGTLTKEQKVEANQIIDEECKRFPKVKNYLADFPTESDRWLTPAASELLKRVATNQPIDAIDESRFAVPDLETLEKKDTQEILKFMDLFESQLMFADYRLIQLSLLQNHGAGSYRQESNALKSTADNLVRKLADLHKEKNEIHRERSRQQGAFGKQIKDLEDVWEDEVRKVNDLREAIKHAKREVEKHLKNIEM